MDNDEVVSILNGLIETCKDGEAGFRTCAEHAHDPQLKTLFEDRGRRCTTAALELQDLVRTYGGDPERGSSLTGVLHRRWIDIKSVVTERNDHAILVECERGEDVAVRSYRNALDKVLPPEVRSVVERQYRGVLKNHDEVKRLRDQMQASSHLDKQ
ncbi:MAG TPA: PA2169 family four-helix-bundle protein [Burkholderiaceae bacterium]|jgi:uncharacterized protein (TIGR02284 family)|nr:PA2169 family four-helix-bundle protein [Burkholderiaceae bacterium]